MLVPVDFSETVLSHVHSAHHNQEHSHPIRQSFGNTGNVIPFPNCPTPKEIEADRSANDLIQTSLETTDTIAIASIASTEISTTDQISSTDQELRLKAFIQNAHRMARSGKYPNHQAMQLLNQAWETQKLLWAMHQP
jgi:hypothetical protein